MKKDRNCGMNAVPYPMYPSYQPMPGMQMQGGAIPVMPQYPYSTSQSVNSNTLEQQLNSIQQQINMLDRRVTRLENSSSDAKMNQYSSSNYSDSNYHMM